MPTVPAAGYPTGPDAPPQISPSAGDDFLRVQATPEEFGSQVGAALSRAGAVGEQAGSELAQAAISRQQFFNSVAADGASTKYMQESHKLLYGDPDAGVDPTTGQSLKPGFYALKGQDAINAGAPNDQLDALQKSIAASLPNDRARLEFNTETRRLRTSMDADISRHWDEQLKTAGQDTATAQINLGNRDAATYFNNPDRFNQGLEGVLNNAKKWSQIQHGMNADPAVYANDMAKAGTAYYKSGIAAAVGQGNLGRAEEIKSQAVASGYFTGEEVNWANQLIEPKRDRQDGDDAARKALGLPTRAGAGGGPMNADAVDAAQRMAAVFKRRGYSPEAITGALNNVLAESSLNPKATGAAGEQGYFQFNPGSHLPLFTDAYKGDWSPEAQANYVADVLDKDMPGYKNTTDSAMATRDFLRGFEKPKDQSDAAVAARVANTATATRLLTGGGGTAAAAGGPGLPAGTIDKTAEAGFGTKFGPLQSPQGMIIHHTSGGGTVDDVISTFKQTNYPAQFVIDRQGKIYQTLPDGYQGQHIRDSWGPLGAGKTNANMEGVEIIANNDGDVLPVQEEAAARLVAARAQKWGYDPRTSVFGHGEVNPGHKEADEGMSTVTRIRNGSLSVAPPGGTQVASATPTTMTDASPGGGTAAPTAAPYVIGDSLGVGLKTAGRFEGDAVGGRSPQAVLDAITAQKANLQGKTVVLSTGASNATSQVDEIVPKQIAALKAAGANPVMVGVDDKQYPGVNAKLAAIAQQSGVPFTGPAPIEPGSNTHPSPQGYRQMVDQARKLQTTTPEKPATAGEGAIIYSPGKPPLQNRGGKWVPYAEVP